MNIIQPDNTIQMRQLLGRRLRMRDTLITTLLWALYGYLWLPLISFIAWVVGIEFAYERVIRAGGPEELMLLLLRFLIAFLVILLVVVIWSGVQYSRHHGQRERRVRVQPLDAEIERQHWGLDEATLALIKSSQTSTVQLDQAGRIKAVSHGSPPASQELNAGTG